MKFVAIKTCPNGGTIREPKTNEPQTVEIGDHDSKADAIENACYLLDCRQLFRGVLRSLKNAGGYIVLDMQEYAEV
ncbi:hypothetical protein FR932_06890 [Moritella marina ATCC 15381]|uniref:Uncharacterized protein n=1 Tax=Moritella marina ATCC 15381 TaxID=1202962 RepID=A0A5J6WLA7_MORMI|nr:hypothetical protein [Moritella marina]QFI37585.1 hypothetical protein FR932_06890 [Moritella marina ATCC 15381]